MLSPPLILKILFTDRLLIDAVCIAIREGRAKADDFNIIFFEKKKSEASLHQMKINDKGQIENQPDAYREFFLNHQGRMFGWA